jgi:hypothetical protein
MMRARQHRVADRLASLSAAVCVIEKNKVLVPRNVYEQEQVVLGGEIKKPPGRDVIDAEKICAKLLDERKVGDCLFKGGKRLSIFARSKWTIRDTFEIELLGAAAKELPIHNDTRTIGEQISHACQTLDITNLVTTII